MNHKTLVNAIFIDIVEGGITDLKKALEETQCSEITDTYWQNLNDLYSRLSLRDRQIFLQSIKQSQIDVLATLLASIDGMTHLKGQDENMILTTKTGIVLSGGLSDEFLKLVEENNEK